MYISETKPPDTEYQTYVNLKQLKIIGYVNQDNIDLGDVLISHTISLQPTDENTVPVYVNVLC